MDVMRIFRLPAFDCRADTLRSMQKHHASHQPPWIPADPDFAQRVSDDFARQRFMTTLGATIAHVGPGAFAIVMPVAGAVTQQHGFVHAGVLTALADTACGYAAHTLMPAGSQVLSVEFKLNLLRPAKGTRVRAHGEVLRPGRTVTACRADVYCGTDDDEVLVATMLGTMIRK